MSRVECALRRSGARSAQQLYNWVRAGRFPRPVKISEDGRAVAWFDDEIDDWQEERSRERGAKFADAANE